MMYLFAGTPHRPTSAPSGPQSWMMPAHAPPEDVAHQPRVVPPAERLLLSGRPSVWQHETAHLYRVGWSVGPSPGTQSKGRFRSAVITAREAEGRPHDWTRRPAPADPSGPFRFPCQTAAVRAPRQPCMLVGPWRRVSSVPGRVEWETIRQTLLFNSPERRLRSNHPSSGPLIIARSPPCLEKRSRTPPRNAHRQGWPGYRRS